MTPELGAAYQEFYKLGASGFWCCIDLSLDYNYAAYISLTPAERGENAKHEVAVNVQSCEINTDEGMIKFLNLAVKEALKYERENR